MKASLKFLILPLGASLLLAGCFGRKHPKPDLSASAEPDKVLYFRALDDIQHGRSEVGRLTLQTLINTYPDSEYLAKAKLAIADSYYKDGGTAGLTQAVAEYKDFITFFPFLPEASYAQMQVGMAHYRRLEKPDRDRTEARLAEQEFQTFLQKYPDNPLAPQAEQRLREVQEVLAEGDFRIAHFYYLRQAERAAASRLMDLTNRYPLYSQADRALWMLGQIYDKHERSDIATQYYTRIVKDYPLSEMVPEAKERLTKLGVPIPQPDPQALARMQREQQLERDRPGLFHRAVGAILRSRPDVSMAAHTGTPTMTPVDETGGEILSPGSMGVGATGGAGTGSNTAVVERVTPGPTGNGDNSASSGATANSAADPEANPPVKPTEKGDQAKAGTQDPKAKKNAKEKKDSEDKKKESSSKKKKGLRKLIPW